jgi:hypothetical protein
VEAERIQSKFNPLRSAHQSLTRKIILMVRCNSPRLRITATVPARYPSDRLGLGFVLPEPFHAGRDYQSHRRGAMCQWGGGNIHRLGERSAERKRSKLPRHHSLRWRVLRCRDGAVDVSLIGDEISWSTRQGIACVRKEPKQFRRTRENSINSMSAKTDAPATLRLPGG